MKTLRRVLKLWLFKFIAFNFWFLQKPAEELEISLCGLQNSADESTVSSNNNINKWSWKGKKTWIKCCRLHNVASLLLVSPPLKEFWCKSTIFRATAIEVLNENESLLGWQFNKAFREGFIHSMQRDEEKDFRNFSRDEGLKQSVKKVLCRWRFMLHQLRCSLK